MLKIVKFYLALVFPVVGFVVVLGAVAGLGLVGALLFARLVAYVLPYCPQVLE